LGYRSPREPFDVKAVVSAENRVVIQNQTRFDGRFVAKPPI
jgi:hypothetical protein